MNLEAEIKRIRNELDALRARNVDFHQRRIINAHPSIDDYDYVVRKELLQAVKDIVGRIEVKEEFQKATFGLVDASQGTDKTPHFFVLVEGTPINLRANAKVAPVGSSLTITLDKSTDQSVTWAAFTLNPLTIPIGSKLIHISTSFIASASLSVGDLLRINIPQGDSLGAAEEIEVVLKWD